MKKAVFFLFFLAFFSARAYAGNFVIDASSTSQYEVSRSREDLRAFDSPDFIARNLPGIQAIAQKGPDLYLWDMKITVPMSKPMQGSFLAKRTVVNDNLITFESADKNAQDYMYCETSVLPRGEALSEVKIKIQLKFTRSNGWKFHWMAPLFGQKFISARVKERLDGMMAKFVENSQKEWTVK